MNKNKIIIISCCIALILTSFFVFEQQLFATECYCNDCQNDWKLTCFYRGGTPADIAPVALVNTCNLRSCFLMVQVWCHIYDPDDFKVYLKPFTVHCTTSWCDDCDPPAI